MEQQHSHQVWKRRRCDKQLTQTFIQMVLVMTLLQHKKKKKNKIKVI